MLSVPRTTALGRHSFEADYKRPSRPVLFTELAREWPAVRKWSLPYLRERWGHVMMEVARMAATRVTLSPRKGLTLTPESLGTYLDRLRDDQGTGYAIARWSGLPVGMRQELPRPSFCSDSFGELSKLWISRRGTISCPHFDLPDNLHTVVLGRKRFQLWSPEESNRMYPYPLHTGLVYASQVDPERPDLVRFPRFAEAQSVTIEVGPGETLYVPRRWWHYVVTVEDTVSSNAFWADGPYGVVVAAANLGKRLLRMS